MGPDTAYKYLVAFSLAGERRELVRGIAEAVRRELGEGTVFFDEWFEHLIAGRDADVRLQEIYGHECALAVVCVSERYGDQPWTLAEHEAIRARYMKARASNDPREALRILPIRVGDGDVRGISFNAIVPDVRTRSADDTAKLIILRLREIQARDKNILMALEKGDRDASPRTVLEAIARDVEERRAIAKAERTADLRETVNDLELSRTGSQRTQNIANTKRDRVFISYSHKDRKYLEELKTMLAPVIRSGLIDVWDDKRIDPGAQWKKEIETALGSAKIALLLVSQNFLASNFIAHHELRPLLEAARDEGVSILWIYLSSCLFDQTEIATYQAAHDLEKPLNQLGKPQREKVLRDVCANLIRITQNVR